MDREETKKAIEVMQAWVDGAEVQPAVRGGHFAGQYTDKAFTDEIQWNWLHFEYRVKPKPREGWANLYRTLDGGAEISGGFYASKKDAEMGAMPYSVGCILVREVIE